MSGELQGPDDLIARLARAGVRTVGDVLERAECIRDLPDRSNHVLSAGELTVHVKCAKDAARWLGGEG